MARPAILESPLIASDDWYSNAPVLDGTVTEAKQEWEEILEVFRHGQHTAAMLDHTRVMSCSITRHRSVCQPVPHVARM